VSTFLRSARDVATGKYHSSSALSKGSKWLLRKSQSQYFTEGSSTAAAEYEDGEAASNDIVDVLNVNVKVRQRQFELL